MLLAIRKQNGGREVNIISRKSFSPGVVYAGKHVAGAAVGRQPGQPRHPTTSCGFISYMHKFLFDIFFHDEGVRDGAACFSLY